MARYVLLSFEDNDEAEKFVDSVERMGGSLYMTAGDDENPPEVVGIPGYVRAMYARPTQVCECTKEEIAMNERVGRGKKFGWFVHVKCGKPPRQWVAGDYWYAALGRNLLDPTPEAPEWRGEGLRMPDRHFFYDVTGKGCVRDSENGLIVVWDKEKKAWIREDGIEYNPVKRIQELRRQGGAR